MDHYVDALTEHAQFTVGHQRGDLDQGVGLDVQAGHLAVDPHQAVIHPATLERGLWIYAERAAIQMDA
ncbi:hypothetical protein GCM10023321_39570 [Pseudonocardia eucalypti]|uniref:Uncharacterized protein n=1 Tax=Pseudonocardia eucalypti TaxID=648755 RepID=A0ABP9QB67_9PSEU